MTSDALRDSLLRDFVKTFSHLLEQRREEEKKYHWHRHARPKQIPPKTPDWRTWLILAGRGFGKTRTGAETLREWVQKKQCRRLALIGETERDVRDVMIEGESGLIAVHPPAERPLFTPSTNKITWPCGAIATLFSAEKYDKLRGPQFDGAWVDELAKFRYPQETWDQLMFGLRLGKTPRVVVTTTPRPLPLLQKLINDPGTIVTKGNTYENKRNLSPFFIEQILQRYENTRLGAQEIHAAILDDFSGALWQRDLICYKQPPAPLRRIVIAVDPAASHHQKSDETGIIVAGIDESLHTGYVLADLSGNYTPHAWAKKVVTAYENFKADRVVAEVNMGGAMVHQILKQVDPHLSFKAVHASRGKERRAEPIVSLYEQARIFHTQHFQTLENQMCRYIPHISKESPDRMDALVWAMTDLFQNTQAPAYNIWRA